MSIQPSYPPLQPHGMTSKLRYGRAKARVWEMHLGKTLYKERIHKQHAPRNRVSRQPQHAKKIQATPIKQGKVGEYTSMDLAHVAPWP